MRMSVISKDFERRKNMKKGFKVVVIENKTGRVIVDQEEAISFIGAVGDEVGVHSVGVTQCNVSEIAETVSNVKNLVEKMLKEHPEVKTMIEFVEFLKTREEKEEDHADGETDAEADGEGQ